MNVLQYIRKKLRKCYANLVWSMYHFFSWLDTEERNSFALSFFLPLGANEAILVKFCQFLLMNFGILFMSFSIAPEIFLPAGRRVSDCE